jgi:uncharacterized protein
VSADADSTARAADAPLAASDRVAALDVLRGFALLGIFIMNMPGFSHSIFGAPEPPRGIVDTLAAAARETLFAGKFNLLFGLVFGIGFALQTARLDAAEHMRAAQPGAPPRRRRATAIYLRRLAFLFVVGLVHAMLLWSGDVLLVYAVLGVALLAVRRLADGALLALLAACLVYPALSEVLRPSFLPNAETVAAFQYQQFEASNELAYGQGSFLDAVRETARTFDWTWRSPFGLYVYASFFVQMATGILTGFVVGRRGWPARPIAGLRAERRAPWAALAVALACGAIEPLALVAIGGRDGAFFSLLARTIGRASLSACYALVVVRIVRDAPELPRWLRPLQAAGRMPLSNYLLQTVLASFVFYGWGLGLWNRAGPTLEIALAIALYLVVQLPLSVAWLARFRYGPLEWLWRRFTYGA